MHVAVFHYHLQPGGVTDVIIDSVRAVCLQGAKIAGEPITEVTLVCGRDDNVSAVLDRIADDPDGTGHGDKGSGRTITTPHGPVALRADVQPLLDYTPPAESVASAHERSGAIEEWLLGSYAGSLWWVHNYHLGKNPSFTLALCRIAERHGDEQQMLLHVHDFPESARYENLAYIKRIAGESPYPSGPSIRYVAINPHDQAALERAIGGPDARVGLLLNPLPGGEAKSDGLVPDREALVTGLARFAHHEGQRFHEDGPLLLYPVRTIRRKNVLELGAIARLIPRANLITTLPGTSDAERSYSELISFAYSDRRIHGVWGIGRREDEVGLNFETITRGADLIVSSSVQEGFGLTFVNALLWRKPLLARRLDVIDGILPLFDSYPASFYSTFLVPNRSPSITDMGSYLRMRYHERLDAIGDVLPSELEDQLLAEIEDLVSSDTIDFSFLPAQLQLTLLGDLRDTGFGGYVRALNGEIFHSIERALATETVPDTSDTMEALLGYPAYARAFEAIWDAPDADAGGVANSSATTASRNGRFANAQTKLQREFATLSRLRLLLGPLDHDH